MRTGFWIPHPICYTTANALIAGGRLVRASQKGPVNATGPFCIGQGVASLASVYLIDAR